MLAQVQEHRKEQLVEAYNKYKRPINWAATADSILAIVPAALLAILRGDIVLGDTKILSRQRLREQARKVNMAELALPVADQPAGQTPCVMERRRGMECCIGDRVHNPIG